MADANAVSWELMWTSVMHSEIPWRARTQYAGEPVLVSEEVKPVCHTFRRGSSPLAEQELPPCL